MTETTASRSPSIARARHVFARGVLGAVVALAGALAGATVRADDCNGNGADDLAEIAAGQAPDCNGNGVPDACDVAGAALSFHQLRPIELPRFLIPIVAGDLDGDGDRDLAGLEENGERLRIILNSGDGLMEAVPDGFSLGSGSPARFELYAADLDGDGRAELLTAQAGVPQLAFWRFEAGALASPARLTLSEPSIAEVAVVDLNADGVADIVVRGASGAVSVFLGQGDLRYEPAPGKLPLDVQLVMSLSDIDSDGVLDMLGTNTSDELVFLAGKGDGTFGPATALPPIRRVFAPVAADIDGDGHVEILGQPGPGNSVRIYRRGNGGVFESFASVAAPTPDGFGQFSARDADGDGDVDILFPPVFAGCGPRSNTLFASINAGGGRFRPTAPVALPAIAGTLVFADFDGDGIDDLASTPYPVVNDRRVDVLIARSAPASADCDADGVPDDCVLWDRDRDWNGVLDSCDIARGDSLDCNGNGVPDLVERDCDGDEIPDECAIANGATDADGNGVPDSCETTVNTCDAAAIADPAARAAADCDGNGVLDTCDREPALDLSFYGDRRTRLPAGAFRIAGGDFDGDGDPEVMVARSPTCCAIVVETGRLTLYEFSGDAPPRPTWEDVPSGDPRQLLVADVDGAPGDDLIVLESTTACGFGPGVAIWLGGEGGPRRVARLPFRAIEAEIRFVDVDADGHGDIVLLAFHAGSPRLEVWSGDGTGAFVPGAPIALSEAQPNPVLPEFGDVDGDGRLDIAGSSFNGETFWMIPGRAAGGFGPAATLPIDGPGFIATSYALADVDGDGDNDWVLGQVPFGSASGPRILIAWNDGDLAFARRTTIPMRVNPGRIALHDVDGDGLLDIVVSGEPSPSVTIESLEGAAVVIQDDPGTFEAPRATVFRANGSSAAWGDFDGDDRTDLVFATRTPESALILLRGLGDGALEPVGSLPTSGLSVGEVAADLDRDGRTDVVIACLGVDAVKVHRGVPEGGFRVSDEIFLGAPPSAIAAGDLDGDGDLDLAIAHSQRVSILEHIGLGRFRLRQTLASAWQPLWLAVADMDGDGDDDLLAASSSTAGGTISVAFNTGAGDLAPPRHLAAGGAISSIDAGDLDEDGRTDIVVTSARADNAHVFWARPDGTLEPERLPTPIAVFSAIEIVDVNGDGILDLVTLDFVGGASRFGFHLGLVGRDFAPPRATQVFDALGPSFELVDLDRDGDLDLLTPTFWNAVRILRNRGGMRFADDPVHLGWQEGSILPADGAAAGGPIGGHEELRVLPADVDNDGDEDIGFVRFGSPVILFAINDTPAAAADRNGNDVSDVCESDVGTRFVRGEMNQDGALNLSDAVDLLQRLFVAGGGFLCRKAADANDDGSVNIADAVSILRTLFLDGVPLPGPSAACGIDPTEDALDCVVFQPCEGAP